MKTLYPLKNFVCYNYEKGQNAQLEILRKPEGFIIDRNLIDTSIVFLVEGKCLISYGKLVRKEIGAGKIMLFPPGSCVVAEVVQNAHCIICRVRDILHLCECMSIERLHEESNGVHQGFHMLDCHERISQFVGQFEDCVNDGLVCGYFYDTKVKELFFLLRAYYTTEQLSEFFSPLLSRDALFMNLMYKNYRNVKTVQELAALSHYSLSGFKRRFRRVFGTSASEWMNRQKAARVYQDLHISPLSFKELADLHDFSSVSAFSNFCTHQFGMPPGKIRLNVEKIDPEKLKMPVQ